MYSFLFLSFLMVGSQQISVLIILLIMLLFLAFVVSGSKLAFFSLKQKEINLLKLKSDDSSKRILKLTEHPKLLAGILTTAQLILNLSVIIILNYLIDATFGFHHPNPVLENLFKVLTLSAFILLFCEMLPKVWAHHHTLSFLYFASWWVESIIFPPLNMAVQWIQGVTDKFEKKRLKKSNKLISDEELNNAIDQMTEEEASIEEKQILKGIQEFSHTTVKQVMRARLDVSGIDWNLSFNELLKTVTDLHYSRYPVYKGSLDEIAGILQTKDLLMHIDEKDDFNWRQLIHTAFFVPEQKLIEDLLREFQQKRTHIAVVVDEFGGTSGIVTMEDILEEIIGEIEDEFDEEETLNRKVDDFNYLFEGKTMIHEVCRIMNFPGNIFDNIKGESESLAGLILEIAERLPKVNDVIESGDFAFTILDVAQNRIQKVKVTVRPEYAKK